MTTRNDYIADVAARMLTSREGWTADSAIEDAVDLANKLESAGVAPWKVGK